MEPAAGFQSPRPFPRAAAPPASHAGPGPPENAMPGAELEMLAGPPATDPGRPITDPRSGRTYFKGRLLGKVSWRVVLERVEGDPVGLFVSAGRGACPRCGDICGPDPASPGAPYLKPFPIGGLRPLLRGH